MIEEVLNSLYNDKKSQLELINKFKPGFLKFDDGKIEINRTVDLNIPLENIIFSQNRSLDSDTFKVENDYDDSLVSKGSIKSNINISATIKSIININFQSNMKITNDNTKKNKSKYIRYKHFISNSLVKISVPQKDFKLDENIKQEFRNIFNKETNQDQLNELFRLYNKYGIGIAFEFILGGKYYMYFDARNDEEKDAIVKDFEYSNNTSVMDQKGGFGFNNNSIKEINQKRKNLNMKLSVVGGDPEKKDNYNEWLKSINLKNLEIIQYKSLQPLHDFCDDDVKEKIEELLKNENRLLEEKEKAEGKEQEHTLDLNAEDDENAEPISIILLGDNDSGKTSLIKRFVNGKFSSYEKETINHQCYNKIRNIMIDNKNHKIKVQLNEHPVNTNRLKDLDLSYINQYDGIIVVLDINNKEAIQRLNDWGDLIAAYKKKKYPVFLIPNKADLAKYPMNLNEICQKYDWTQLQYISCKKEYDENFDNNMISVIQEAYQNQKKKNDNVVYKKSRCF